MMSDGNFHIGDKVVYPNHGVGVIEQISSRTIGASVEKYYLLKIKSSSLKVMVPFHNVSTVGLRRVVRNGEIQKIVDFLTDGECSNNSDWKYRFKENSEKMRTGSLLEVAMVLKGLLLLNQTKPLSFREKKMLERARYLLVSELAMAKNREIQKIVDFLTDGECSNNSDWKYRFKENSEKMRTGSLLEVAMVLKGLLLLNQTKPLSFREKKMLERARYLLVSELAMAKNLE